MKVFISIKIEATFSNEDTERLEEILKNQNKTFNFYMSENIENILIKGARVNKEAIKSIEIKRVD